MRARALPLALIAFSLAGLAISAYLTWAHYQNAALACADTSFVNCDAVTHSSFSYVPGTSLPVTLPGLAWFALSAVLSLFGLRSAEPAWPRVVHFLWALVALAAVIYLVRAELLVIHLICEWCTAVHLLIFATFVVTLVRLQQLPARAGRGT